MTWRNKVVWSEGMLLQPQHLQQSERHADHARHLLLRTTTPYAWGFAELEIDAAALTLGKLALVRAVGVFGDGTVFDMPAVDPLPEPIDIPDTLRDEAVLFALPLRRAAAREADAEAYEDLVRHRVLKAEVPDSNTAGDRTAMLQLGALNARLMRAGDAGRTPAMRLDFKPMEMDAGITQFILDVDGQLVKYAHGPVVPMAIQWPGPKGSNPVRVQVSPPAASGPSGMAVDGPCALFRVLDDGQLEAGDAPEKFFITFQVGARKTRFEVTTSSVQHPIRLRELREFACPEGL